VRKGLTVAISIGATALPAVALGGPPATPEYGGELEKKDNHYLGFDVKGSGGDRKITNKFAVNVPFKCEDSDDNGTQSGDLERSVPVKANGSFDETHKYTLRPTVPRRGGGGEKLRYRLAGDLDGDKATGFVRIELLSNGPNNDCDSGKQHFKVKSPAPPPPPPDME
jgi:hypothetical protein